VGRLSNLQPPRGSRMFWIFFGMVGDNSAALVWDRSVVGCRIRSYIHCILCTPQPKMYISMHCTSAFHIYHAVFLDIVDVLSSSAGTGPWFLLVSFPQRILLVASAPFFCSLEKGCTTQLTTKETDLCWGAKTGGLNLPVPL
jgi:hypothetical protein